MSVLNAVNQMSNLVSTISATPGFHSYSINQEGASQGTTSDQKPAQEYPKTRSHHKIIQPIPQRQQ